MWSPRPFYRKAFMRYFISVFLFLALFVFLPAASFGQAPSMDSLTIKIRQTVFPEDFTREQLRVYRLEAGRLQILIEGYDDPEAEVSVEQALTEESMELLQRTIEQNRIMSNYIDCRVYTPASDTRLKTEMMIRYQGQSKVCYSFDQGFSNELSDLLSALNQIIPEQGYRINIPRDHLNSMEKHR